jgi:4-hydroxy-tetrahydrodipicolinate synthase
MEQSLQAQIDGGVDGIILGGTLGEASTLDQDERVELLKFSIEKVGDKVPVLMNVAEATTKNAVLAANLAADNGADGLMLLPPMRYTADDKETVTFMKAVAKATDLPIIVYNNPVDYKIEITIDMFKELLEHDTIQAVKDSTRDISNITRFRNAFGNRLNILTGVDTLGMESILMGADGWVAGLVCAFPKETVAVYKLAKEGKIKEALRIYRWFLPLLELDVSTKLVQNIKLAAEKVGIGTENVRSPRLKLYGEERKRVLKIIDDALAIRPEL